MSRLGKKPLSIPSGVSVDITDSEVIVKNGKAELREKILEGINVVVNEENSVVVSVNNESREAQAMWGTMWSLINNMLIGVTDGFKKTLEVIGVGYRASLDKTGKHLKIVVGYSHPVLFLIPEGLDVSCESLKGKPPTVTIKGYSKFLVGQFAAIVRDIRKPEPYKGKGIRYNDEIVLRKESSKK